MPQSNLSGRTYGPFLYSPIVDRPPLRWPNGARLAVWVCPNIEFFPLDAGLNNRSPNIFDWSMLDYGNRVGVFRLMQVLADRNISVTAPLNSDICLYHERIIEEGEKRNWEWVAHCESNSRPTFAMPAEEERQAIERSLAVITETTGRRPLGWLGAGGGQSWSTMTFLAELGVRYVCDFVNDDQPYATDVGSPPIVALPYSVEVNDRRQIDRRGLSPEEFGALIKNQFDVLWEEGAASGKVLCIALHPWIIGVPHRIKALEQALDYIQSHSGVWFASGTEIYEAFLAQEETRR